MQKNKNNTETYNNQNNLSSQKSIITNPIDKGGLVAKINVLGSGINSAKVTHTFTNHHNDKTYGAIDYAGFIKETKVEGRKKLVDSFVNSIYLFDDHFVITFNYKNHSKTVTLEEVESSCLTSLGQPFIGIYAIKQCINVYFFCIFV